VFVDGSTQRKRNTTSGTWANLDNKAPNRVDWNYDRWHSLDDAKAMAAEVVGGLLETYLEYGNLFTIPPVTDAQTHKCPPHRLSSI